MLYHHILKLTKETLVIMLIVHYHREIRFGYYHDCYERLMEFPMNRLRSDYWTILQERS